MTYNTYFTDDNPNTCLTVGCLHYSGYHSAMIGHDNPHAINTFMVASYLDGVYGAVPFDLVPYVLSHEIAEWANDPFPHYAQVRGTLNFLGNPVPEWTSPYYPYCQPLLEVSDPLEFWALLRQPVGSSTVYGVADAAFLSWFARQSPSTGIGGLYDEGGIFSTYSDTC